MKHYYILLKEQVATKEEKSLLTGLKTEQTHVLEGSLWFADRPSQKDRSGSRSASGTKQSELSLVSSDFDSTKLKCGPADVGEISEDGYLLLYAFNSFSDRIILYRDAGRWSEAKKIIVHSTVYVSIKGSKKQEIVGKVRYKGLLPNVNGTWFGVELSKVG